MLTTGQDLREQSQHAAQENEQGSTANSESQSSCNCGKLERELQACQADQNELKSKFMVLNADYANYRRRVDADQAQLFTSIQIKLVQDLLPIIDNFERAYAIKQEEIPAQLRAWVDGIAMVYQDLVKLLARYGVTEIDCTGLFNPEVHEALMQVPGSGKESGTIIQVFQKGYQIKEKVVRPAKVSVAQ